jgi:nucleoside-triphosphatase
MHRVYLLTGRPGVGKTSLIREALAVSGVRVGGFYTEEVRSQGTRVGFDIITLDGRRGVLARMDLRSSCRVGKYGVDSVSLDSVGVPALDGAIRERDIIVVDEIGKMELSSAAFKKAVLRAIDCGKRVLGTIMLRPHPWADQIKVRPDVKVVELTTRNRDQVLKDMVGWLAGA